LRRQFLDCVDVNVLPALGDLCHLDRLRRVVALLVRGGSLPDAGHLADLGDRGEHGHSRRHSHSRSHSRRHSRSHSRRHSRRHRRLVRLGLLLDLGVKVGEVRHLLDAHRAPAADARAKALSKRGGGRHRLLLLARALDAALQRRLEDTLSLLGALEEVVLLLGLDAARRATRRRRGQHVGGHHADLDELLRVGEIVEARDDLVAELLRALHNDDVAGGDAHRARRKQPPRRALGALVVRQLEEELRAAEALLDRREGNVCAVERGLDLLMVLVQRRGGLLDVHGLGHFVLEMLEGWSLD
jgi:hypothetical protein